MYTCLCTHVQSVYVRQSLESVDRGAWRWSSEYTTFGDENGARKPS